MEFIKLKRKHRKAEQWQALARQWSASGETQKDFCLRYGLNPKTFSKWAVDLQREQEEIAKEKSSAVSNSALPLVAAHKPATVSDCITLSKGALKISFPLSVCPKLLDRVLLRLNALS
jgi:hypothetical protein